MRGIVRPGDAAWITLAAVVAVYEAIGPELLSEAVDRYIERHPILTRAVIAVTALHLANLLPPAIDPYHWITQLGKGKRCRP